MKSKTLLSKFASVFTTLSLVVAGTLVSVQPAQASVATNDPALTGSAVPGGTLNFSTPLTWDVAPTQTITYRLVVCNSARVSGSDHGELIWDNNTSFNGIGGTGCEPFYPNPSVRTTPVYSSVPISLPTGSETDALMQINFKYLAIAAMTDDAGLTNRKNFISKTFATAFSSVLPDSITGTPSLTQNQGSITPSFANSTGNGVYFNWFACSAAVSTPANGAGALSLPNCVKIYRSMGQSYMAENSNVIMTASSYFQENGASYSALSLSGKHIVFAQYYTSGSGGYAHSASVQVASGGVVTPAACNPSSITTTHFSVATLTPTNSYKYYANNNPANDCIYSITGGFTIMNLLNGVVVGTPTLNMTSGLTLNSVSYTLANLTTSLANSGITVQEGDVYTRRIYVNITQLPTVSTLGYISASMVLSPGGSSVPPTVTEEVARAINVTLASSKGSDIHNAVAKVAKKGISSNGARVIINDINPDDIATVTLNGKALKVYTSDAGSAIAIPKGSQSGDLVFTMSDGTVVKAYDAVSITATKDPAKVKARELPTFAANSTVVPAAVKAAIKARKAAILKADNAQCIGYATANTDAAKAAAKKRANKVCGIITDINEEIEPLVAVLVKKKAGVAYKIW